MGYHLSPAPRADFINELLTQDPSDASQRDYSIAIVAKRGRYRGGKGWQRDQDIRKATLGWADGANYWSGSNSKPFQAHSLVIFTESTGLSRPTAKNSTVPFQTGE